MAIIPTDAALGPLPSGRSGAQIVSIDDPGRIGRAVAQLGQSMEGAAAQLAQSWEQNAGVDDEAKFQAFQNERMLEVEKLTTDTTPEQARGLTLGYINETYKPAAKQFLDSISPKNRAAYTSKLINLQGATFKSVYGFEETAQKTASFNLVNSTLANHSLPRVARYGAQVTDPKIKAQNLDDVLKEYKGIVDTLPYSVSASVRQGILADGEIKIKKQFYDSLPDGEKVRVAEDYGFKASDLTSAPAGQGSTGAGGGFLSRGQNLPQNVGSAIDAAAAANGVDPKLMRAIAAIESSGNPRAVTGSNKGLFQLSDDIFTKYGKGGDIFDPAANANAAAAELADFQKNFIARNGRPATAGEIYLYHQQGVAGAPALLANPTKVAWQAVRQFYGSDAIAKSAIWGNIADADKARFGSVENVTAGDFTNYWKQKVEGGVSSAPSPYNFSGINPEYILESADKAQRQMLVDMSAADAAAKQQSSLAIATRKSELEIAIRLGDSGVGLREILTDPVLNNDYGRQEQAALLSLYNSESSNARKLAEARAFIASSDEKSPFNKDTKDAVNAIDSNDSITKNAINNAYDDNGNPTPELITFYQLVKKGNYIPDNFVNSFMGYYNSRDKNRLDLMMRMGLSMYESNPQIFAASPHADDMTKAIEQYSVLTRGQLYSGEEATSAIISSRMGQAERSKLKPVVDDLVKKVKPEDALASFYRPGPLGPIFGSTPTFFNKSAEAEFVSDYREIYESALYETGGDEARSKMLADGRVKKLWGANISNDNSMLKYPVSSYYAPIYDNNTGKEDFSYVRRDVMRMAEEWLGVHPEKNVKVAQPGSGGPTVQDGLDLGAAMGFDLPRVSAIKDVYLKGTRDTAANIAAHRPPEWDVYVKYETNDGFEVVDRVASSWSIDPTSWQELKRQSDLYRLDKAREGVTPNFGDRPKYPDLFGPRASVPERKYVPPVPREPGSLQQSVLDDLGGIPGTLGPDGKIISPYGKAAPAVRLAPTPQKQAPDKTIEPAVPPMRRNTPSSPAAGFPRIN